MSETILHVTDDTFSDQVLQADLPVLVDFWAEWCGPCRMIAPVLEELSKEYQGKVKFVKVDVDKNPVTASKYSIMSIPTLTLFKNGNPEATQMGAVPKSHLTAFLNNALS